MKSSIVCWARSWRAPFMTAASRVLVAGARLVWPARTPLSGWKRYKNHAKLAFSRSTAWRAWGKTVMGRYFGATSSTDNCLHSGRPTVGCSVWLSPLEKQTPGPKVWAQRYFPFSRRRWRYPSLVDLLSSGIQTPLYQKSNISFAYFPRHIK